MPPWPSRLPLSQVLAIFASISCLLVLVPTLSGGLVAHLRALYGLPLYRLRCCLGGIAPVGFAAIGQGSQEPAVSLTVDKFLAMLPTSSRLSVLPSNHT